MRIPVATLRRLLAEEPKFSEHFMNYLLTRSARVEADLVDHLFNNSEKRLAGCCCSWRTSTRRIRNNV